MLKKKSYDIDDVFKPCKTKTGTDTKKDEITQKIWIEWLERGRFEEFFTTGSKENIDNSTRYAKINTQTISYTEYKNTCQYPSEDWFFVDSYNDTANTEKQK